jgi:DsbC/DsbD-like thiol-disulfide interchange protein
MRRRDHALTFTILVLSLMGMGFDEPAAPAVKITLETPSDRNPVVAGAAVAPARVRAGDTFTLVVEAKTASSWHIFAADAPTGGSIPTTLKLKLPEGVSSKGEWVYPAPTQNPGVDGWVYDGDVTFRRRLKVAADAAAGPIEITCEFGYQACDASSCRPPTKVRLKAKAEILPAR